MTTTIRNIEAIAKLTGQGLIEGQTYHIVKANIIPNEWGLRSAAWIRMEDGSHITVKNVHLVFDLVA